MKAASRIALGQVSLLVSLLMFALFLGLIPDRDGAVREGRAALGEALAANSSAFVTQGDIRRLEGDLRLVVERNDDMLSAALRRDDGELVTALGDHDAWREMSGQHSTDSQIRVPIFAGNEAWGQLELRFEPVTTPGWWGLVDNPATKLLALIAVGSFVAFRFYLTKMLKHLDPSQAIPARVRSALDTVAEGLLVVDVDENIVLANQAFADTVGIEADALLGKRASSFAWTTGEDEPLAAEACPWAETLDSGDPRRNVMLHFDDPTGKRRAFMVNCSPILGGRGKHVGALVSFDDVTELEEKEIALRASMEEANAANRSKSEFLANMSHEIRTPMNAILGFTELLRRGTGDARKDAARYLGIIHSSGQHLLDLINDILDLSKVESGRIEMEELPFAPHTLVRETLQVVGVKAREKGIALDFRVEGDVPATIQSDPARVRQIITNLVGNAIRFTDQGGVRVVERLDCSQPEPRLVLDVVDTGVGIPGDKFESIFEAFVQADSSTTRRFGGTGLGLAISRRFARHLGGDVTVQSRLGEGSTFRVTLATGDLAGVAMLKPEEALAADVEVRAEAVHWEFPKARVLVVDDGPENRELIRIVLEEAGLQVDEAENGAVAVEKTLAGGFDVVLMDMQMPVMDGFTATRRLREEGVQLPIFALTAHAMKGFEKEFESAGCTGHVTKPVDIDFLMETLAGVLNGRRTEGPAKPAAHAPLDLKPAPAQSGAAPAGGDGPIESRLAGHPKLRGVIRKFPERLAGQLEAMQKARAQDDFAELADLAHWLKGAGGTVGFDVFAAPAAKLEQLAKARRADESDQVLTEISGLAARLVVPEES